MMMRMIRMMRMMLVSMMMILMRLKIRMKMRMMIDDNGDAKTIVIFSKIFASELQVQKNNSHCKLTRSSRGITVSQLRAVGTALFMSPSVNLAT